MKKLFLWVVSLFLVGMSFAKEVNRNVTYHVETKTLAFTGGRFNNCFYLPIKGDLSDFKSLVIDCIKCESAFRVKVEYRDEKGELQKKEYYQNAKMDGSAVVKKINLSELEQSATLENIEAVSITSCEGAQTIVLNTVYLLGKDDEQKVIEINE